MDRWVQIVTAVYGPNDKRLRTQFWKELTAIRDKHGEPWILGGDFNITRFANERRGHRTHKDREEFNLFISQLDLIDLPLSNLLFMWSNMKLNPSLAKLDRVFISKDWNAKILLVEIFSLQRPTSDHIPICLNSREIK